MAKNDDLEHVIKITATLKPTLVNGEVHYLVETLFNSTNPCVGIDNGYLPDGTHCVAGQIKPDLALLKEAGLTVRKVKTRKD